MQQSDFEYKTAAIRAIFLYFYGQRGPEVGDNALDVINSYLTKICTFSEDADSSALADAIAQYIEVNPSSHADEIKSLFGFFDFYKDIPVVQKSSLDEMRMESFRVFLNKFMPFINYDEQNKKWHFNLEGAKKYWQYCLEEQNKYIDMAASAASKPMASWILEGNQERITCDPASGRGDTLTDVDIVAALCGRGVPQQKIHVLELNVVPIAGIIQAEIQAVRRANVPGQNNILHLGMILRHPSHHWIFIGFELNLAQQTPVLTKVICWDSGTKLCISQQELSELARAAMQRCYGELQIQEQQQVDPSIIYLNNDPDYKIFNPQQMNITCGDHAIFHFLRTLDYPTKDEPYPNDIAMRQRNIERIMQCKRYSEADCSRFMAQQLSKLELDKTGDLKQYTFTERAITEAVAMVRPKDLPQSQPRLPIASTSVAAVSASKNSESYDVIKMFRECPFTLLQSLQDRKVKPTYKEAVSILSILVLDIHNSVSANLDKVSFWHRKEVSVIAKDTYSLYYKLEVAQNDRCVWGAICYEDFAAAARLDNSNLLLGFYDVFSKNGVFPMPTLSNKF